MVLSRPAGEPAIRRELQCTAFLNGLNHNKFWRVEIWPASGNVIGDSKDSVYFEVVYGRVGSSERREPGRIESLAAVEKIINAKLRGRSGKEPYHELQLHKPTAAPVAKKADAPKEPERHPKIDLLVEWIFAEAGGYINGYLQGGSAAVAQLSKTQIDEGRLQLQKIQALAAGKSLFTAEMSQAVQTFYNLIPTKLPPRPDPVEVVHGLVRQISEQEERLNQLEAAIASLVGTSSGLSQYDALGAHIERLAWKDSEHEKLVKLINSTSVHGWRPNIKDIFAVTIPSERKKFEAKKPKKTTLVFHGSRNQNIRHILQQGLRIPKSVTHGWMFGPGIYVADKFSKSGNYCASSKPGVPQMAFILDADLGKSFVAPGAHHYTSPPRGYDSVMGKAGKTRLGTGTLFNDEFVLYHPEKVSIRYLVTFERQR